MLASCTLTMPYFDCSNTRAERNCLNPDHNVNSKTVDHREDTNTIVYIVFATLLFVTVVGCAVRFCISNDIRRCTRRSKRKRTNLKYAVQRNAKNADSK